VPALSAALILNDIGLTALGWGIREIRRTAD
jgi:hypothetical protein